MTKTIGCVFNYIIGKVENQKLEGKPKNKNNRVFMLSLALVIVVASFLTLVYFRIVKNPLPNIPLPQQGLKVSIKTQYKNPFDKKTQYVNPFETYKNPFVVAK